jgi:drug/metabolite transporter (DMT)-like permease
MASVVAETEPKVGQSDWRGIIALVFILGFFTALLFATLANSEPALDFLAGQVLPPLLLILGFYFGAKTR